MYKTKLYQCMVSQEDFVVKSYEQDLLRPRRELGLRVVTLFLLFIRSISEQWVVSLAWRHKEDMARISG